MVKTKTREEPESALRQRARAEAAVWIARLRSDIRTEQTERALDAWLAASPEHSRAFERLKGTWETTGLLRLRRVGLDVHGF